MPPKVRILEKSWIAYAESSYPKNSVNISSTDTMAWSQGLYSGFNDAATVRDKHAEFIFRPNSVFQQEKWKSQIFMKIASFWNKGM